jgi:hypothetical protein
MSYFSPARNSSCELQSFFGTGREFLMRAKKKDQDGQWPDCPDRKRKQVPNINLALQDMVNPCELAEQWKVKLSQLWAYEVRDGQTGQMKNDFMIARNRRNARIKLPAGARLK